MNNNTEELIERYLYDVVKRLPEKQKADIEKELRTLIDDMILEKEEMKPDGNREQYAKEVLNELGNPAKLARSYRGENDSLISGEYYDSYCYILKIVLICAGVGIIISNIVSAIIHVVEAEGIAEFMWNDIMNIGMLPSVLIQVFGWITLGYIILERNHVKVNINSEPWTLEELPQIPYKKAVISRGESAVGLAFGIIVLILFAFVPQLMGAWVSKDGTLVSVPLFNLTIWKQVLPLFILCFCAGIIDDFVKLAAGRYNYKVMLVTIVTDIFSYILTFIIFKMYPVWNENFISEIKEITGRIFTGKQDIMTYFNTDAFTNGFLIIMLLIFLLDMGTTVYYTVRYGNKNN